MSPSLGFGKNSTCWWIAKTLKKHLANLNGLVPYWLEIYFVVGLLDTTAATTIPSTETKLEHDFLIPRGIQLKSIHTISNIAIEYYQHYGSYISSSSS